MVHCSKQLASILRLSLPCIKRCPSGESLWLALVLESCRLTALLSHHPSFFRWVRDTRASPILSRDSLACRWDSSVPSPLATFLAHACISSDSFAFFHASKATKSMAAVHIGAVSATCQPHSEASSCGLLSGLETVESSISVDQTICITVASPHPLLNLERTVLILHEAAKIA